MADLRLEDVLGPIMVGPSSSHTAGALRIASMARQLLDDAPRSASFTLFGSFARTYRGHGTDRALVAGLLGLAPDDMRIRDSFALARAAGLDVSFRLDLETKVDHPNTVDVSMTDGLGQTVVARGESVGGGQARLTRIDGNRVEIAGDHNSFIVFQHDVPGVLGFITGVLGREGINIGSVNLCRSRRGGEAFNVLEVDEDVSEAVKDEIIAHPEVRRIIFMAAQGAPAVPSDDSGSLDADEAERLYPSVDVPDAASLLALARERDLGLGEAFLYREEVLQALRGGSRGAVVRYLDRVMSVMARSAGAALEGEVSSMGGLIGGEARSVTLTSGRGSALGAVFDNVPSRAAAYAMAALETNASMGRIVAAPTAGSCGVLPGVLMALDESLELGASALRDALACAAAVGYVVSRNATVSGAEGGCQAEMGTASAMAAAAAAQLLGGDPESCLTAASIALTTMLGLVCDPVGGLVEDPCQKRNAAGATNALVAAQMALAGVRATAPLDETVEAMRRVGQSLPFELRETALGGMAACPSCRARCGR
ncbi:L-serine ammonia-lyase, iron-sulfur-dependent, subunit alpha [Olsenella massiliensis]|nr:L-serine ammonia-lyase, iron-sulfur-dependent, subunit alpha [Olsenella massiliensis]